MCSGPGRRQYHTHHFQSILECICFDRSKNPQSQKEVLVVWQPWRCAAQISLRCHSLSHHAFGTQYSMYVKAMPSQGCSQQMTRHSMSSKVKLFLPNTTPLMVNLCPEPSISLSITSAKLCHSLGLVLPNLLLPCLISLITHLLWSGRC